MITLLATLALSQRSTEGLAIDGLDPVALCSGKRVKGDENLTVKFELYTYAFANEANRKKFESNPVRWGIQISGACANMGPLSGRGAMQNWAVHKGRIFIFASGTCKKSFQANPDAFIDEPNPRPNGSSEQATSGRQWIEKAIIAHGGWKSLSAMNHAVWREHIVAKSGETVYWYDNISGFQFPNRHYRAQTWEGGGVHSGSNDGKGWQKGADPEVLGEWERGYLIRENYRYPWVALRLSRESGFTTFDRGITTNMLGEVRAIDTSFDGATTTLFLDPTSGRIEGAKYYGRPGGGANRWLTIRYYDYRDVAGVKIPFRTTTTWPSQISPAPMKVWTDFRINDSDDSKVFEGK